MAVLLRREREAQTLRDGGAAEWTALQTRRAVPAAARVTTRHKHRVALCEKSVRLVRF